MYPQSFFGLFPPFPREDRAFVAMSFDDRFRPRWENVIEPAIRQVPLEPYRVDLSKASDSILTDILRNIASCRVVVADITEIGQLNDKPVRNANVLYEVGLAHATRLPEEVILIRSDRAPVLFDITQVKVFDYDPDDSPDEAREQLRAIITDSLAEIGLKEHLAVKHAARSLDFRSRLTLCQVAAAGAIHHPETRTAGQALAAVAQVRAISRLLEIGALRAEVEKVTPETLKKMGSTPAEKMVSYRLTPFGDALVGHIGEESGALSPEIVELLAMLDRG